MSDIQETLRSSLDQCRQECAKLTMAEQHLTKALAEALAENARFREALEHYQAIDDELERFKGGFTATRETISIRSIARQALKGTTDEQR